jgi:enoyl-[acyl-carrier protein] reductase I
MTAGNGDTPKARSRCTERAASPASIAAPGAAPEKARTAPLGLLAGKVGLITGVANDRSIAWAIAQALRREGAQLAYTHLPGVSNQRRVAKLVRCQTPKLVLPCDVQSDTDISRVFQAVGNTYGKIDFLLHSIAFAPPAELRKPYLETSRKGWHLAMDISAYSLVAFCREARPLLNDNGTIVTITYFGGEKVMPGYNLMGVCKAALEHSVRYLAWDLGRAGRNLRINAISAGPMRTLSSVGISDFERMRDHAAEKSCLGRNVEFKELGTTGLYLLSHLSGGLTGEVLHVDSGYSIVGL